MRQTPNSQQKPVEVVGGNTFGRYQKMSSASTYNMYITEAEGDNWLVNTAGYYRILDIIPPQTNNPLIPSGTGRGLFVSIRGGFMLAVVNSFVYTIDADLNATQVPGNLASQTGEVFIDENLNGQICIVDGINAYIYNYLTMSGLVVQNLMAPTLIPGYVEFQNNQFLIGNANRTTAGSLWYAYIYSSATVIVQATPGNFPLQTKPDYALAAIRLPGQGSNTLVLGSSVCEVWTQIGGLQNYRKNNTISIDYGCISVSTIAKNDNFVAFLAVNETSVPVIIVYTGQSFEPISTYGIDYFLSNIRFPAQSSGMFVKQDGHLLYQLTFYNPADNITLLYDFGTKKFFYLTDANGNYHPSRDYVYFNGATYFLSINNTALYQSSTDFTTYNENLFYSMTQNPLIDLEIQRIRICPTLRANDSSQFRANSFVMTVEQGNDPNVSGASLLNNSNPLITEDMFVPPDDVIYTEGGIPIVDETSGGGIGQPDSPPPYQPHIDLSISADGGITWSNWVERPLNPIGFRPNILNWENMGLSNSWTPKLRFWGMDRFVVYDGILEVY